MSEKKTTRAKKNDTGFGWISFLLESVWGSVQSSFDGAMGQTRQVVRAFTKKIVERIFLSLFAFLGIILLLVGLAQLLSSTYQLPGSGEVVIGVFILVAAVVMYLFVRNDN